MCLLYKMEYFSFVMYVQYKDTEFNDVYTCFLAEIVICKFISRVLWDIFIRQ